MSDPGLTEQELAHRHVTTGAGRPMDDKARAAVTEWLNYVSRKPSEPFSNADEGKVDLVNSPPHYTFPGGVEVIHLSQHLTSNGGQAVQYIARATRLDGRVKGRPEEDLEKAVVLLTYEIQRLRNQTLPEV